VSLFPQSLRQQGHFPSQIQLRGISASVSLSPPPSTKHRLPLKMASYNSSEHAENDIKGNTDNVGSNDQATQEEPAADSDIVTSDETIEMANI